MLLKESLTHSMYEITEIEILFYKRQNLIYEIHISKIKDKHKITMKKKSYDKQNLT